MSYLFSRTGSADGCAIGVHIPAAAGVEASANITIPLQKHPHVSGSGTSA